MDIRKHQLISIIIGTTALSLCWFFWYPVWGIFISLFSIILAIVAIALGKNSIKTYKSQQELLKKDFYRNAKIGFNLGVAGLIISFFCFIFSILFSLYFKFLN